MEPTTSRSQSERSTTEPLCQYWPCRKMVKCQYTTFILAILVDLPSPMTYAKIQPQGIFRSGEEDFLRFLPYMGMAAILVNESRPF